MAADTSFLSRVPVDQIHQEAQQIRFWRTVATAIAGLFFLIGWVTAKTWLGVVFCFAAVRVGFRQGMGTAAASRGPGQAP